MGYKLEVPPVFPAIASGIFGTWGQTLKGNDHVATY
jgi:hypothetical protein